MFKMLIVEDTEITLTQLRALLCDAFPESRDSIEVAATVAEAKTMLAAASDGFYDAVILDLNLPSKEGESPEIDESLCLLIRERDPSTLVAHVTAYSEDERVQKHIRQVHTEQPNPHSFVLSKRKTTWAKELTEKLQTYLFSNRIDQQMDEIFGGGRAGMVVAARARPSVGRGGTTHRLALLCRDIEAHWTFLDDGLKKRIHSKFNVEGSANSTHVSLL